MNLDFTTVQNTPRPPIDYVWDSQGLGTVDEAIVCFWVMELVEDIALYLYHRVYYKDDPFLNKNSTDVWPETYEDKYYQALYILYNTYIRNANE